MARTVLGLFAAATGSLCSPGRRRPGRAFHRTARSTRRTSKRNSGHRAGLSERGGLISGGYILDQERSDHVMQALNSAVDGMTPSIARLSFARRLRKAAAPGYAISISFSEGRFSIKIDDKRLIDVSTSGEAIEWKLVEGLVFDVSATANGEVVSLTFRAPDSERTTVYRSDGQQLVTEATIISPLLSTPIRYRVVYNRAS